MHGEAMVDRFDPKHRMEAPPTGKPTRYSVDLLEMACQHEDNGGQPVLNPRDVGERSLFNADVEFMREKSLWRAWKQWFYDAKRGNDS